MTIKTEDFNPILNIQILGTGASSTNAVVPQPVKNNTPGIPSPKNYALMRICNPNSSPVAVAYANGTNTATATATGTSGASISPVVNGNSVEKFRCSFAPLSVAVQFTTSTATGAVFFSFGEGD